MSDLDRVLVLAGGLSAEREVSLRSGQRVAAALRDVDVDVAICDVGVDLLAILAAEPGTVVFPVLHGTNGEDGTIRQVLDLAGAPYVGAEPEACRIAFDKTLAKAAVTRAGLLTPPAVTLPRQAFHDLGAAGLSQLIIDRLGLPLFVKPRAGGSAFGVSAVSEPGELATALMGCFGYHDSALIERAITGTEITVGVLDLDGELVALPTVEIVPDGGVYDYTARYTAGATEFFCPARLPAEVEQAARDAAMKAHRALGLRDLSRTDMIVDETGRVFILETNVAPGMTDTSTFLIALAAAGYDFAVVCRDLAARAAERVRWAT